MWPTVLEPLRSADDVRRLVADDELWDALTAAPLGALLRDTFADDTVRGIVATDALIGRSPTSTTHRWPRTSASSTT